jgi:glycosyltransferase involved in cell wall biosynthesis
VTPAGKPRVLIVHPSAELYGSDRVALESARALVADGWLVHASLTADGPLVGLLREAGAEVTVLHAPVLRKALLSPTGLVRFAADVLRRTPAMLGLLRRARPDLVYVSTVTSPLWLPLARLGRHRVVVHLHEAEADVPKVVRVGLAAPLLLAHRIVANSAVSRDVVAADLPRLRRRTDVVYNGVLGPPAPPAPARESLEPPVRLVLSGRLSPRKGTDVAVAALAELRRRGVAAELDLVGGIFPGYEWFERDVAELAEREGVAGHVHHHGVLPQVWDALAAADVVLVPSRVEPFGNAAVEAMLAERPVVAGRTQGLVEIVRPGDNGSLAEPGDATSLADAVQGVLDDWPAARARARRARVEAEERYSPARYRSDLAALARATVRRGRDGAGAPDAPASPAVPRSADLPPT